MALGLSPNRSLAAPSPPWTETLLAVAAGAILGLALVQFGNPVILDDPALPRKSLPMGLGPMEPSNLRYWLLAVLGLAALPTIRWPARVPRWVLGLPLVWLAWQCVAATQTVDGPLTRATLKHFAACVAWFYLGVAALSRLRSLTSFWLPAIAGLVWVLWTGFDQHLWGLEATRSYFLTYEVPNLTDVPAELLKRINSRRIFATFVYPNALAGALLLVVPPALIALSQMTRWLTLPSRCLILGTLGMCSAACLVWSGSKSAWLIALGGAVYVLLRSNVARKWRKAIAVGVLTLGLAGFAFKFADYFQRGATSVGARVEYWRVAFRIGVDRPVFGSGPGTFAVLFSRMKTPEAEMARLAHNDYLEQFSDSGVAGFVAYAGLIAGSLVGLHGRLGTPLERATWLGCAAWAVHGLVDFTLYIPGIAWPAFLLLGWLWGATGSGVRNGAALLTSPHSANRPNLAAD